MAYLCHRREGGQDGGRSPEDGAQVHPVCSMGAYGPHLPVPRQDWQMGMSLKKQAVRSTSRWRGRRACPIHAAWGTYAEYLMAARHAALNWSA